MPITVLPSSSSSTLTGQSNSEDVSLSVPGRACQDVAALSYATERASPERGAVHVFDRTNTCWHCRRIDPVHHELPGNWCLRRGIVFLCSGSWTRCLLLRRVCSTMWSLTSGSSRTLTRQPCAEESLFGNTGQCQHHLVGPHEEDDEQPDPSKHRTFGQRDRCGLALRTGKA